MPLSSYKETNVWYKGYWINKVTCHEEEFYNCHKMIKEIEDISIYLFVSLDSAKSFIDSRNSIHLDFNTNAG